MNATPTLAPQHAALVAASAIRADVADARGYRTVTSRAELRRLGFSEAQARTPALLLPVHSVTGDVTLYQVRPDQPRIKSGKLLKYETPAGAQMTLDVPPAARPLLSDPRVPLVVTEGIRKADAAVSAGLCCVALLGVWNWRGTNSHGGKVVLPAFEYIALNGRDVYIAFDSDVMIKREVLTACDRLSSLLISRGARVHYILLPSVPDGTKQGLDDFLAAGHGTEDLFALARAELPRIPSDPNDDTLPYRETARGLVYDRPTRDGVVPTPLTNFTARIVADVSEDDGTESRHTFELEATLAGRLRRFTIPASQFAGMAWATEYLGAQAIVYPGMGTKDHARAAVQLLSDSIPERAVYTHTGWREIDGVRCYLHGGGVIGPDGRVDGIDVALPAGLTGYVLPDPPESKDRHDAIRASLRFLNVAPARITYPLLAATVRAAIGPADLSLHVTGPTGAGKSELAALCQQHYGAALDARHLPASWDNTANANEALAHAAKDALFVVDDFMPNARGADAGRLHRDADRLLRAKGNGTGRQRMRADTTLRPAKPPRALLISTGEDTPNGQSLRARLLHLDLAPDDVDWEHLRGCQADAAAGQYAAALAGFVRYLAAQYPDAAGDAALLRDGVLTLRDAAANSRLHRRTPEIVAHLMAGWQLFLRYAFDTGAIDASDMQEHSRAAWTALGATAQAQVALQATSEPARRFVELVTASLASGQAHLAAPHGGEPDQPGAWGWRLVTVGTGEVQRVEWRAQGARIGWVDAGDVFLERDAAFRAARELARGGGDDLTIGRDTLGKRLHERSYLSVTEARHGELTVRKVLDGQRRRVWQINAATLYPSDDTGQSGHDRHEDDAWPDRWPDGLPDQTVTIAESGHDASLADAEAGGNGRIGRPVDAPHTTQIDDRAILSATTRQWPAHVENPARLPATRAAISSRRNKCAGCGALCGTGRLCWQCASQQVRRRA